MYTGPQHSHAGHAGPRKVTGPVRTEPVCEVVTVTSPVLRRISCAALSGAALLAVAPAAPAAADHATLFALEVFEAEAAEVPAPLCDNTSRGVQAAASTDLPNGTVPVAVVQGSVRRPATVNRCRFRVRLGNGSVLVYNSADTRVDARRLLDRGIRVVAARDEQTGVLVAERVVGRATARNEVERAFLASVLVTDAGVTEWTATEIGGAGREFTFDVTAAEIEVAAGTVAIEFDTVAPVPD